MFCSAMPTWMKRSGNRSAKKLTIVDSLRSPTSTTMRGSRSPRSTSARPKPSRVFFISTLGGSEIAVVMGSAVEQPLGPRGVRGAELLERGLGLLGLGRLAVPAIVVGHERDALAHDGVGEDHGGLAAVTARLLERAQDRGHVVTVAFEHVPLEGAPLVGERCHAQDILDVAVDLLAVVVDHRAQAVVPIVPGE